MKNVIEQGSTALRYFGLLCFAIMAPTAFAQDDRSGTLEEIIVTGTKRDTSSQDVPIALTAISEEQLKNQFRTDILALGEMTPGVALGQAAGFRAIAGGIRGTGQNSILVTQDSSVVLLVDEFGMANVQSQFVEMFDIERVEIYRGPQGTLFGKSATGGAISLTSKRPVMNEYFADLEMQYGKFDGDDGAEATIEKYRGAVNIPLIEDKLAIRAVAIWDEDEGYYTNDKATAAPLGGIPLPPGLDNPSVGSGENLNNTDVFASKVKILWQPNDMYEAYFIWSYLDDNSGSPPGVNESEPNMLLPLIGFPSIQQAGQSDPLSTGITNQCQGEAFCVSDGHRVDVDMYQLHQSLKLEEYTVQLLFGERKQKEVLASTYTGEAYRSLFDASRNTTRDHTQWELRINSEFDGRFNFVAGASYEEEEVDMLSYATVGLSGLLAFDPVILEDPTSGGAAQERETTAFYGDFTYDLSDAFTLTAGIRYTKDEKEFFRRANPGGPCTALTPARDQVIVNGDCLDSRSTAASRVAPDYDTRFLPVHSLPLPNSAYGIAGGSSEEWDETTYRLVLNWNINDDSMAYASYATGFISGGYTETCSSLATCLPYSPETNSNFELGYKGQFAENSIQFNVSAYYTEYEDLIRSQVVPFTNAFGVTTQETINVNAGVSEVVGLEGELTWLVNENLRIDVFLGLMDHEYKEFDIDTNNDGILEDLSGNEVPFSPELKYGISATYEHAFWQGSLAWNANFNHQDESEFSVFNSPLTQFSERDLIDANVTYHDAEGRYSLTLWGKNLSDERYRIGANSVAGLWNFTMYGRPRSYGMEFSVHFN